MTAQGSDATDVPADFEAYATAAEAGVEGERFTDWLCEELDREGAAAPGHRRARLDRLFRRTVELEVAFFETAYDADGGSTHGEKRW